ncbi:beta-lactamase/transpeptidase-like protein [Auriculariales sp. MPI-PUGE-AT-0066]|nr:beta-lactamase/transpeptidase-like protein [Auriculariales sp. MPI-PUGE-AT-0066]
MLATGPVVALMSLAGVAWSASLRAPQDDQAVLKYLSDAVIANTRSPRPVDATRTSLQGSKLLSEEITQHIKDTMALWDIQGLSIAVVRRRSNDSDNFDVETHAFGVKGRDGAPMTTDTLVPIASNSKAFTAAAAGLLVDNNDVPLKWTTKLRDVLDGFELQDPIADAFTCLEDALSHRTGLPRHDALFGYHVDNPMDFSLNIIKDLNPSAEFRDVWQYNNHMFNIAASLVTRLSGTNFTEFLSKNVFDTAGFKSTTFDYRSAIDKGILTEGFWKQGETLNSTGKRYASWPDAETHAGAGGVLSTADDISIWLQVLLNDGKSPVTKKQVLPSQVLAAMTKGRMVASLGLRVPEMGPQVYGMGFISSSYQGHQYVLHGGSLPGYKTQILRFPNDGLGIAVLVNDEKGTYVYDSIMWRLAEDLLQMPTRVDWNERYRTAFRQQLQKNADDDANRLPSPPNAPLPGASLDRISATYSNPAYGTLAFKVKGDGIMRATTPTWNGAASVLSLQHFSGNLFNATLPYNIRAIDEPELIYVETMHLQAEFEIVDGVVKGFGLWGGGLWGAGEGVESGKGSTAREKAEVWFDRNEWPWESEASISPQAAFEIAQ